MTPDDLTHSQTLHITMSQQAKQSAVGRRENGLRGPKPSHLILYGKYAVDLTYAHNVMQIHSAHALIASLRTFLAEVNINTS